MMGRPFGMTVWWMAVAGCAPSSGTVSWSTCDRTERNVEDDEVVDGLGISPADVLAEVSGVFPFAAAYGDGGVTLGEVVVARRPGSAVASVGTLVHHQAPSATPGSSVLTMATDCEATLSVPVDATITTEDGLVDLAAAAEAGPSGPRMQVTGRLPADEVDALPGPEEEVGFAVQWDADGVYVSVWRDGADYTQVLESP